MICRFGSGVFGDVVERFVNACIIADFAYHSQALACIENRCRIGDIAEVLHGPGAVYIQVVHGLGVYEARTQNFLRIVLIVVCYGGGNHKCQQHQNADITNSDFLH